MVMLMVTKMVVNRMTTTSLNTCNEEAVRFCIAGRHMHAKRSFVPELASQASVRESLEFRERLSHRIG